MTLEDIHKEIMELRTTQDAHSDFIGILLAHSDLSTARFKALSELFGDLLEKHGVNKLETEKRYESLCAKFAAVAQQSSAQALNSCEKSRLPPSSGPEAERN
jgi:hypothetical protein